MVAKLIRTFTGWLHSLTAALYSHAIMLDVNARGSRACRLEGKVSDILNDIEDLQTDLEYARDASSEAWAEFYTHQRLAEQEIDSIRGVRRIPPPFGAVPQVIDKRSSD